MLRIQLPALCALVLAVSRPALHDLRRRPSSHSPLAPNNSGAPRQLQRSRLRRAKVMLCEDEAEQNCKSGPTHPSKRRPVSASEHSSREVGQPDAGAQPEPELARSILVLHQLALHTRPRDGWGSLIRTGSNAATSEQLNRPWDTPTAAPAGQTIDSACCNRRPSQRCGPPSSWRRSRAPRLD